MLDSAVIVLVIFGLMLTGVLGIVLVTTDPGEEGH
jgi:hypothetical protein